MGRHFCPVSSWLTGIVAVVSLSAPNPNAQSGANLSGEWTLASETIVEAKEGAQYRSVFRFGSHLKILQDERTFKVAIWTLPIDGDVVTDATGGQWRARRQTGGIGLTAVHGKASAGTDSSHSMSFRLMPDGRLSVEITADPALEVRTVKSVYAKAVKAAVPPTRPNFAGRWIVDESRSQLNGSTGWFSNDAIVALDDKGLTVASGGSGPGSGKSFFPTDGSEVIAAGGPGGETRLSRAEWRGTDLIVTTMMYSAQPDRGTNRVTLRTTERGVTLSLSTDGALVVEVSYIPTPTRIGFATRSVYRRVKS